MKCYYTYDDKGIKHFIPMCYGTVDSRDIEDCSCQEPITEYRFAKERFNKILNQKDDNIKELESEIKHLRRVIYKLNLTNK